MKRNSIVMAVLSGLMFLLLTACGAGGASDLSVRVRGADAPRTWLRDYTIMRIR